MQSTRTVVLSTGPVSLGAVHEGQVSCRLRVGKASCIPALITQCYIRGDADLLAIDGCLNAACLSSQDSKSKGKGIMMQGDM